MSVNYAGLYSRLKDPKTSLKDKLKLTRFAWRHGAVYIPNKQQVLIDVLASLIITHKKINIQPDEENQLWNCFAELLSSHLKKNVDHSLLIKTSISQIIIEKLLEADPSANGGLFNTCSTILSSPFSRIFSSKQDQMITLLACLCRLVLKFELREQACSEFPSILSLLNLAIKVQNTAQQGYFNQNKVLHVACDKLLPQAMQLLAAVQSNSDCGNLTETATKLMKVLQAVIFHKDHIHSYRMYLSIKYGDGDGEKTQLPKSVDHVFRVLEGLISKQVASDDSTGEGQNAVCDYLPLFYDDYLSSYKHDEKTISSHKMLQHMISFLGVKPDSADIGCLVVEEATAFREVNRLIEVVQKHDAYNIAADNNAGNLQLTYYRHVLDLLLKARHSRTKDWYSCLLNLMRLNHRILEPRLQEIFADWLMHQTKDEESLDIFLTEIVSLYDKLRQFPKWISVFLSALRSLEEPVTFTMPPKFSARFGEAVQSLAQTVTVDIWKSWLEEIFTHYTSHFSEGDFSRSVKFEAAVILFHHFLMNVKVTGYNITDITARKVKNLMVSMGTELLKPVLTLCLNQKGCHLLMSGLLLSHGWGELSLLLNQYTKYGVITPDEKPFVSSPADLSFTHTYLTTEQWKQINTRVEKEDNYRLLYVWNSLILQKLRFTLQISSLREHNIDAVAMEMDLFVVSLSKMVSKEAKNALWDGNFPSINADNCVIAQWDLIVNKLPMSVSVLSHTSCKLLADFVLQTCDSKCVSSLDRTSSKSLYSLSKQLMESPVLQESITFQNAIVVSLWQHISREIGHQKKSPKRRKLSPLFTLVLEILDQLGSDETEQENSHTEVTPKTYLQQMANNLNEIMKSEEQDLLLSMDVDQVQRCMSILSLLPLENLDTSYQFRCMFGLIVVLTLCQSGKLVHSRKFDPTNLNLVMSGCIQLLTVILEACSTTPVFQLIDAETYLDWLLELYSQNLGKVDLESKSHLLMEMSAYIMTRDIQTLPNLDKFQKLTELEDDSLKRKLSRLQLGACLTAEMRKVLKKPTLKDSDRDHYLHCMKILVKPAHSILCEIKQSGSDKTELDLMSSVVDIYCNVSPAVVVKIFSSEIQREEFNLLFDWSCHVLKDEQNKVSVENKISALNFLYSSCRDCKLLADIYTNNKKLFTWITMKTCLPKIKAAELLQATEIPTPNKLSDNEASTFNEEIFVKNVFRIVKGDNNKLVDSDADHIEHCKNFLSRHKLDRQFSKSFSKNWRLIKKYLCYHGNLEQDGHHVLLMQIHNVLQTLVATFDIEQFSAIFKDLNRDMESMNLVCHTDTILSAILVLQQLVSCALTEDQCGVVAQSVSMLMLNLQSILEELSHSTDQNLILTLAVHALDLQTDILLLGQNLISPNTAVLSLHSCLLIPLEGASLISAFHAVHGVLTALLIHHTTLVLSTIPSFLACAKRLMKVILHEGRQDRLHQVDDVKDLIGCANLIDRLFTLIVTYKVDFSKVAVYVVADYVTDSQQVTLLPAIKKAVLPGIYKMLDLCDRHSISQLHTVLGEGVREVFKVLYSDYIRYHKYTGKV